MNLSAVLKLNALFDFFFFKSCPSQQRSYKMFCLDVALGIVESYQGLRDQKVLQLLARKPEAFSEKKSNFIKRIINSGTHLYLCFTLAVGSK
ncbi:hypothetical protein HanRHA438_Chr11g0512451 [Helianthus annuus]|nr:hypothetical protein HanRHA438_Chr11g0512451 [Helianthus annuus]